jgi:hypothetical protein
MKKMFEPTENFIPIDQRKLSPDAFASSSIRVDTPDGTMYVFVMEDETKVPFKIQVIIGKSGSSVQAWAYGMAELISSMLASKRFTIHDVIVHLSGITTDKYKRLLEGPEVRSGVEGLVIALLKYRDSVFTPAQLDDSYRPPSFGNV